MRSKVLLAGVSIFFAAVFLVSTAPAAQAAT
jgi:hypothetical protein